MGLFLNHRWRRWFHFSVFLRGGLQVKRFTGAAVGLWSWRSWKVFDGLREVYVSDQSHAVVRCPKLWWLLWAIITFQLTQATSPWILSKNSSTPSVPWVLNPPPSTIWSASSRWISATKQRLQKSWAVCGAATWCHWIFPAVSTSQQPHGSSCVERRGGTWRKPISQSASQREKWLKVFLFFCSVYCTDL